MKTYDPREVNVVIDSTIQTDFAPEQDMFTLQKVNDMVAMQSDALGNVTTAINPDNVHTCAINYNEGSEDLNRILQKSYNRESFDFQIVDSNDYTKKKVSAEKAFVQQIGDLVRGADTPTRTVTFIMNPTFDFS